MKKIIITLVCCVFVLCVSAQVYTCDLQTGGIGASPSTISIGQTSVFKFYLANLGPDPACVYPPGSIGAIISLPSGPTAPYTYVSITNPPGGTSPTSFFSYTYNAVDNTVEAVNVLPVGNGEGDIDVSIQVIGVRIGSAQASINIERINPAVSDNPNNNTGTAQLVVTAVLPLRLQSFTGSSNGCSNTLNWKSNEEKNVKSIDIETSEDGTTFRTVGTVAAKNVIGTNNYNYTHEGNTAKAFYRLKISDIDGHVIYSDVVTLNTQCKQPSASMYPNPMNALTDGTVVLKNFTGKITGQLQDMGGKQLSTIKMLNGSNTINLNKYAQGTYLLKITDENQQTQTLKIVTYK